MSSMRKWLFPLLILVILILVGSFVILKPAKTVNEVVAESLAKKYNQPVNNLEVATQANTGTFAKGTVNYKNAGGGVWFAVKANKDWEVVFDGNGIINCAVVNKYKLPKDLVPGCVDNENGGTFVQR